MPGFNITGAEVDGPTATAEVRRTHRWVFQSLGPQNLLAREVRLVLQKASRPSITFEEPSMHHDQEQIYFAGKHTWDPLDLAWYDVEQTPDISSEMHTWLEYCLDLEALTVAHPRDYKATESQLSMTDGQGDPNETWTIYNGWPQAVNWGGLDYTSTDLQLVEVKYRFDRARKTG